MGKISNEQIMDMYDKFKSYYLSNKDNFLNKKQSHIVSEIENIIKSEDKFQWNNASLKDVINALIYMVKGKQFARTLNKFSKKYFIENLCRDFDKNICNNAKKAIQLHERYYKEVTSKNRTGKNIDNKKDTMGEGKMKIKNIILYGSPGVGKTYNTNKLIRLIEDTKSDREIFDTIKLNNKSEHVDISDIKDRVKFITFHQSFGYEDFIEGFRPNEEGKIELVDGIFKAICDQSSKNMYKSLDTNKLVFDDAFDILLKDKIEDSGVVRIDLNRDNSFYEIYDYNHKSIYYTRQGRDREEKYHTLAISTLKSMYEAENIDVIAGGLRTYYKPLLNKLLEIGNQEKIEKVERKNYYLVIDEINRGNISKIFGELITLIEEDKRDNLEVTLPYSKEVFKIPSNLYIIGTMNSTDKSIALIDIALRRRFTFLKMKPNSALIGHEAARNVFEKLNTKITETLGEDYQIGHSYFMQIGSDDDLAFVLEYKIKPLLEEYYYGDTNGLNSVLGLI